MTMLSVDLDHDDARPYFLWNESTTVGELRRLLGDTQDRLWPQYAGTLLREARVHEVWRFLSPATVAREFPRFEKHLGRRRKLWKYLLEVWTRHGAV